MVQGTTHDKLKNESRILEFRCLVKADGTEAMVFTGDDIVKRRKWECKIPGSSLPTLGTVHIRQQRRTVIRRTGKHVLQPAQQMTCTLKIEPLVPLVRRKPKNESLVV